MVLSVVVIKFTQRVAFFFCPLAGVGLVYGCYQIYPENAETIRYVGIVKRKALIFFSQLTELKFSNLNTWNKSSWMFFLPRVYFRENKIRENSMPHGIYFIYLVSPETFAHTL